MGAGKKCLEENKFRGVPSPTLSLVIYKIIVKCLSLCCFLLSKDDAKIGSFSCIFPKNKSKKE